MNASPHPPKPQPCRHFEHNPFIENERSTRHVVILTAAMMVIEIAAGWLFGSMALLADGWHMGTHAAALGISLLAYSFSRRNAQNPRFTFGSGKINILGGYTSAVALMIAALLMAVESIQRLISPQTIRFDEAIIVAAAGLAVNLFSAYLLSGGARRHKREDAARQYHDHNLRAAYLHVLADALTSLLAIFALLIGKLLGWVWLDALAGLAGAAVIARWSWGLLKTSGSILLDSSAEQELAQRIYAILEDEGNSQVCDLHLWHADGQRLTALISLQTAHPQPAEYYKNLLQGIQNLAHITVEVNSLSE